MARFAVRSRNSPTWYLCTMNLVLIRPAPKDEYVLDFHIDAFRNRHDRHNGQPGPHRAGRSPLGVSSFRRPLQCPVCTAAKREGLVQMSSGQLETHPASAMDTSRCTPELFSSIVQRYFPNIRANTIDVSA